MKAIVSSVLPTPVGPRNRKLPRGRALRRQAEFAAVEHGCDARKDVILSADLFGEMCFEVAEMFETVGGNGG